MNGENRPRFIADVMLGRLAKWLRLYGYYVEYSNNYSDSYIVERASTGLVVLTRDTGLLKRRALARHDIDYLFIRDDDSLRQLKQVIQALGLRQLSPRCPVCSGRLLRVRKESVEGLVPPYVYVTSDLFTKCETCGRIFWKGTHWKGIAGKISEASEKRGEPR